MFMNAILVECGSHIATTMETCSVPDDVYSPSFNFSIYPENLPFFLIEPIGHHSNNLPHRSHNRGINRIFSFLLGEVDSTSAPIGDQIHPSEASHHI